MTRPHPLAVNNAPINPNTRKPYPPQQWVGLELIKEQYVAHHERKGWLTRDFHIGGRHYLWRANVPTKQGLERHGILADLFN